MSDVAETLDDEELMSDQAEQDGDQQEDDQPGEPLDQAQTVRVIEALLFASASPLSVRDLHERMPNGADVGGALLELKAHYEGRGVNLVDIDGSWAFRTSADLADALSLEKEVTKKLSRAALETLAIIAYHQPITRAEVENIRGVATHRGTLDALIEAGWVKPGRRRETPGRPLTWVTTAAFLDQFNLESILDLPGLDDLKAAGLLDRRPAIDAIPGTPDDTADLFSVQENDSETESEEDALDLDAELGLSTEDDDDAGLEDDGDEEAAFDDEITDDEELEEM